MAYPYRVVLDESQRAQLRTLVGAGTAPARLLTACSQATGVSAATTITKTHAVMTWNFPVLVTTLLDTPDHMHR